MASKTRSRPAAAPPAPRSTITRARRDPEPGTPVARTLPAPGRRSFAFLRAINVGGHTVPMARLRALFEEAGLAGVETFIASGNVVFETGKLPAKRLEQRLEAALADALGYPVATFVRSDAELAAIVAHNPFPDPVLATAVALNVALLAEPLDAAREHKLASLSTAIDDFQVQGREIFWLCREKQSESTFSGAILEKTLGCRATLRSLSTLRKLAAKYLDPAP